MVGAVTGRLDTRQLARRNRLVKEMELTLEIIPGRSIGPLRLGMTFQEIEATLRSLHSEPVTLHDLGIVDHGDGLEILLPHTCATTVLLLGRPVDQISLGDLERLLRSTRCNVRCDRYWGHLETDGGIHASKFERDDRFMFSITVTAPEPFPPRRGSDQGAFR